MNLEPSAQTTANTPDAPKATLSKKAIRLRTMYFGTPDFSKAVLDYLLGEKFNIVSVVTRPDTRNGSSAVKKLALEKHIPVLEPSKIDSDFVGIVADLKPDLIITFAYGKILPIGLLKIPGFGCLNIHASLLPQYRGASPIQNAILNGETRTGISIMLMDEKMDEGPVLSRKEIPIGPDETTQQLLEKVARQCGPALVQTVNLWINRNIEAVPQQHGSATYCQLIEREDGHILWNLPAQQIYNMYRAFQPWPGAFSFWKTPTQQIRIKFLSIEKDDEPNAEKHPLGHVFRIDGRVAIQTGSGRIFPAIIQPEGKKPMLMKEFLNGQPNFIGSALI